MLLPEYDADGRLVCLLGTDGSVGKGGVTTATEVAGLLGLSSTALVLVHLEQPDWSTTQTTHGGDQALPQHPGAVFQPRVVPNGKGDEVHLNHVGQRRESVKW